MHYSRGKYPVRYLTVERGQKLHIEEYPSFHKSGSIMGMKNKYYGLDALLVRCGSYIYNVTSNPKIYWDYAY